ncbi:MAG: hypothetical protein A3C08_03760 [Candidatus Taylorbacteria bacterium RIFCSPHIGHO2_02_FULL_47_18]|uniref:tRNA threonylcarbamoyladenosine biosynthesis protein TsaE n=1 Tax=Candidatus Taylorbacteria bacterium RIFCSPLOWO2_01_FULL_48_100 TaxID=1802322 RepID=A0A1G2NEM8_9BACT|nr:MAG: hypothetical protein A2670_00680 [Candidatus Taylorbacteria bacterium RIFCSPHIGHO2_01_FULL_48_38]OHA28248.1 MAG: hypothetical protein A3C08_03760 [Candidatus Taylorbacteria bacterium RIFCSPHIGHO2_02_FULL_47_18]OHA34538.1 MAG: hypothetical protein A2938_03220 [Candidatus Taylorbacteria bacterium RIFCSPLOWO2_01_FULL_48_100]OHA40840.1 MAG: hypothetical protein A3J31_03480 [Candidatus Taylorbacteria bacterium RIFCSPLOWO2_02_FULL_48_16]OHA45621.1 MAG: hypothetical protein A3H13_02570 [Candid
MKEILSHSIADTAKFAQEFLAGLFPCADSSTVVGLYGDLGSGKTAFVQQIAKALGARGSVQSPTFVIMKKYALKNPPSLPPLLKGGYRGDLQLVHIDAYRLDSATDLKKLGWDALSSDHSNLIFIEWADRVADILPLDHIKLRFEFVDDTTRKIS